MSDIKQDIKQCMYAFIIIKLYFVVVILSSLDSYKIANCLLQNYYERHSDQG